MSPFSGPGGGSMVGCMAGRFQPVRFPNRTDEGVSHDPSRELDAGDLPERLGGHRPAEAGRVHRGLFRVRSDLYGLRGRVPGRGHGRRTEAVHPVQFGLRRHLRHHRGGAVQADRQQRRDHSCPAGGLPDRLQDVRGRVRLPR
ncbi:hypothetical protein MICRO11B_370008 [Micrococcus luteus]|nr:hypothetical protein MICRO11B_370008 [Micrococcus luteus]